MGIGERMDFSILITDHIPNYHFLAGGQCFPLYLYEKQKNTTQQNLLEEHGDGEYKKTDAITDDALKYFTDIYSSQPSFVKFTKEDLFYYIYGLLHSREYCEKYADNLSKQLPRIPAVKNFDDFMLFSQSGRKLADIHINYEQCKKHPLTIEYLGKEIKSLHEMPEQDLLVEKMKFPKNGKITDKTTIIYNNKIILKNIPIEAFEYEVNGRPAIDWVLERQCVSINKDSNIVNDANDFAIQTQSNPAYIIELLQSIISVSIQTIDIVESMPKFEMV